MGETVVALVSDLHCNSTTALCPPVVNLDDRGQYHAGPIQRAIWPVSYTHLTLPTSDLV